MKPSSPTAAPFESTYALLMRSEEKQRSAFETLVYTMLIVSTVFAVSQLGRQPFVVPPTTAHTAIAAAVATHPRA
jgi:hypothetical protein